MDIITNNRNYILLNESNEPMCVIDTASLTPTDIMSKLQEALNSEFDASVTIKDIVDVEDGFMFRIDVEVNRGENEVYEEQLTLDNIGIY